MRVIVLGSGGSSGTPAIDWGWGQCDPGNPRNRRTRASIVVEEGETRVLFDTSPDLRFQLLDAGISRVDAIVYTHAHADHLHGVDDVRALNRVVHAPIPAYADAGTIEQIASRFAYVIEPVPETMRYYYRPALEPHEIADGDHFQIGAIPFTAFEQDHGFSKTLGFRFGDGAYSTDVVELPEHAFEILEGVKVWIIGTLMNRPHGTHCHVAKALTWIERVRPERAILTHLGSDLDYAQLAASLPPGVEPAYDGMVVDVPVTAHVPARDRAVGG